MRREEYFYKILERDTKELIDTFLIDTKHQIYKFKIYASSMRYSGVEVFLFFLFLLDYQLSANRQTRDVRRKLFDYSLDRYIQKYKLIDIEHKIEKIVPKRLQEYGEGAETIDKSPPLLVNFFTMNIMHANENKDFHIYEGVKPLYLGVIDVIEFNIPVQLYFWGFRTYLDMIFNNGDDILEISDREFTERVREAEDKRQEILREYTKALGW